MAGVEANIPPVQQQDQAINVFNPDGELVSIPMTHAQEALQSGYRQASPQEVEGFAKEQEFGTPSQQAMTFAESAAKDATFGLSRGVQTALGGSPYRIRAREETNPVSAMAGSAAGLIGSAFIPGGEGAVIAHIGEAGAAKLIPKAVTTFEKVGSAAVRGVIENAIVGGGDEVAKMIVQDPHQSMESAIVNVGLAGAIGGVAGGALGAVSPLWEATLGPKTEGFLKLLTNRANGDSLPVAEDLSTAIRNAKKAGVEIPPELQFRFSDLPGAERMHQELIEGGTGSSEAARQVLEKFKNEMGEHLQNIFKKGENASAEDLGNAAKKVFSDKAEAMEKDISERYKKLLPENENITVSDKDKLNLYNKIREDGTNYGAKGNPLEQSVFRNYAERINPQSSIQDFDKLITEINGEMQKAWNFASRDTEKYHALKQVKETIRDFQDHQIGKAVKAIDGGDDSAIAKAIVAERRATRAAYSEYMEKIGDIFSVAKLGGGRTFGQLQEALDKIPAAKLADKLFDKRNVEALRLLKTEHPEVFDALIKQRKASMLEDASYKGDLEHNKLLNSVHNLKDAKSLVFSPEELKTISGIGKIMRESGKRSNPSGTAGTADSLWRHLPAGAGAMASMLMGHNPAVGFLLGQAGKFLSRDAPDMAKLSLMKFLGSSGPVDAGAWKAASDIITNIYKGQSQITRSVKSVFTSGQAVLPKAMIPDERDRKKIEKQLDSWNQNPEKMFDIGGKTAHYMPEHAAALSSFSATTANYLNSIKPKEPAAGIFDKQAEIPKDQEAKYHRAMDIAQQPLVVLEHIKNGELHPQDVVGLQTMYPGLYKQLVQKMTNESIDMKSSDEQIPYKTRLSMAMFMGQPLDGTMQPMNIQAAQGSAMVSQAQSQQAQAMPHNKGSMAKLGKSNALYATPGQNREMVRQGKA